MLEQPGDGDRAGDGFEATTVSAAADLPSRLDTHVPDLTRHAVAAAVRLAAEDQACSDSCREPDVDHVVDGTPGTEDLLPEGAHVGVIGEVHRDTEPVLHLGRRGDAVPAGQDAVRLNLAGALVDGRGEAYAGTEQLPWGHGRLVQGLLGELVRQVQRFGRSVVYIHSGPLLGDGLAGEVADGDADVPVADVDADRERRAGHQGEQRGWSAGAARSQRVVGGIVLVNEVSPAELLGNGRHGAPGQPGPPGNVGPTTARMAVDRLDHPQPVQVAQP